METGLSWLLRDQRWGERSLHPVPLLVLGAVDLG